MFVPVNELAILVSALLAVAVGNIWYSPLLFGSVWMKSLGSHIGDDVYPKKEVFIVVLREVAVQFIFFYALAQLIGVIAYTHVSIWNVGLWMLVLVVAMLIHVFVWERRSLNYILVHCGYGAIVLYGGLLVLVYWPW